MGKKEKKYLEDKISLVRAAVAGSLTGMAMFGNIKDVKHSTDTAMLLIEKDIMQIYKYAKKQNKICQQ